MKSSRFEKKHDGLTTSISLEQLISELSEHLKNKDYDGIIQFLEELGFKVIKGKSVEQTEIFFPQDKAALAVQLADAFSKSKLYACENVYIRKIMALILLNSSLQIAQDASKSVTKAIAYILQGARILDELYPINTTDYLVHMAVNELLVLLHISSYYSHGEEIISVVNQFKNLEKNLSLSRCQLLFMYLNEYLTRGWQQDSAYKDRLDHPRRLLSFWKDNPNLAIDDRLRDLVINKYLETRYIALTTSRERGIFGPDKFMKSIEISSLSKLFYEKSMAEIGDLLAVDNNDIIALLIISMMLFAYPDSPVEFFIFGYQLVIDTWKLYTASTFYKSQLFHRKFFDLIYHNAFNLMTRDDISQDQKNQFYEKLMGILPVILKDTTDGLTSKKSLSYFDFTNHSSLLLLMSDICRHLNRHGEAAEHLFVQAHLLSSICHEITLRYAIMGQRRLKLLPNTDNKRADLYFLMSEAFYKQNRLNNAIVVLEKACKLQANKAHWLELLSTRRKERDELISIMDIDLYSEWQRILNLRSEVQEEIFKMANLEGESSEKIRNINNTIFIKLSTMLDQAYCRFVKSCIHEPSRIHAADPIYFPVTFSKATLDKVLESDKVLSKPQLQLLEPKDVSHDQFNTQKELKIALVDLVNNAFGTSDNKVKITDISISNIPPRWLPYEIEINKLLVQLKNDHPFKEFVFDLQTLGKTCNSYNKNPCNSERIDFAVKALKSCKDIMLILESRGWLKIYSGEKYIPTSLFDLNTFLQEFEKDFGKGHAKLILDKLKKALIAERPKSIDTNFPEIYDAIQAAQPSAYYEPTQNAANPQHYTNEWLFPLNEIAINSKHLYLTPLDVRTNELSKSGVISRTETNHEIDVIQLRPTYHRGSFIHLFSKMNLSDQDILTLSSELYLFLKSNHFITTDPQSSYHEQKITHPLLNDYLSCYLRGADAIELSALKSKLLEKISELLKGYPTLQNYNAIIVDFLILRKLQEGFVSSKADHKVGVEKLLDNALNGAVSLVRLMGKERIKRPKLTPTSTLLVSSKLDIVDKIGILKKLENPKMQLSDLQHAHLLIKHFDAHKKPSDVAALYFEAATRLSTTVPWLALKYLNRSNEINNLFLGEINLRCSQTKFSLLKALNMNSRANKILKYLNLVDSQNGEKWHTLFTPDTVMQSKYPAIYSQLRHLRKGIYKLNYLTFKLTLSFDNEVLLEEIQNTYSETCIKLRHLLDQALSYFARDCLFHPNEELIAETHFPCAINDTELMQLLTKSNIDTNLLSTKFPAVMACIKDIQPYQTPNSGAPYSIHAWLQRLFSISNEAKHDMLNIISNSQLQEWVDKHGLAAFFPICYTEHRLFPWSFTDVQGISWKDSATIYDIFIRLKQLGFKYENNKTQLDELKKSLQDELCHVGINTLASIQLDAIVNIYIACQEQKIAASNRLADGNRMIAANQFVLHVLDQVEKTVNILLNQKPYIKPRASASSSATSSSSSPSATPATSRPTSPNF